jgi:hypothetical protein
MEARQPAPPGTADALLRQARELLNPDQSAEGFPRKYHLALQEAPAVVLAHGEAMRRLESSPQG